MSQTASGSTDPRSPGRLGDDLAPLLAGILMLPVAAAVVVWNELGAIERHRALHEGAALHVTTAGSVFDPAIEGALVHVVGLAETDETLVDEDFAVAAAGALRLIRNVEMFQWRERLDERGELPLGGVEPESGVSYVGEWSGQLIDSSKFKQAEVHANPDSFPYAGVDWRARRAKLGAYHVTPELIERIVGSERLRHESQPTTKAVILDSGPVESGDSDQVGPVEQGLQVTPEGLLFVGAGTPAEPQVGDIRVEHRVVPPQQLTVVAAQRGRSFDTYTTANGEQLFYVMTGEKTANQVFKQAEQGNRVLFWSMRAGGVLLVFIGLSTMMRPTLLLARTRPMAWRMVGSLAGPAALLMSAALTAAVVAIAWISYQPLGGLLVLIVALVLAAMADRIGLTNRGRMIRALIRRERAITGHVNRGRQV